MKTSVNGHEIELLQGMTVVKDEINEWLEYIEYRGEAICYGDNRKFSVSIDMGTNVLYFDELAEARDQIDRWLGKDHVEVITELYQVMRKAFSANPALCDCTNEEVADSAVDGYGEHHNVWLKFDMIEGEPVFRH